MAKNANKIKNFIFFRTLFCFLNFLKEKQKQTMKLFLYSILFIYLVHCQTLSSLDQSNKYKKNFCLNFILFYSKTEILFHFLLDALLSLKDSLEGVDWNDEPSCSWTGMN